MPIKTPEQEFRDFLFKRSQYLYRLENGAMKDMVAPYKAARKEIQDRLIKLQTMGQGFTLDYRIQRLESQLGEINGYLRSAALNSAGNLESTIASFVASDADAYTAMLAKQFGKIGIDIVSLPYAQIDSIANSPLLGEAIGDKMLWLNEEAVRKMRGELTQSIIQGEDMQKATSRLTNLKGTGATDLLIKRRAEIIARSEIQYVSNQVARSIYRENQDVIEGAQYSSALDNRTCLLEDSKILCIDGDKEIKDIKIGDLVYTNKNRYRKVINTMSSKRDKYLKIKLSNGEILKITPDHKVLTEKHGWIEIGFLSAGDKIIGI